MLSLPADAANIYVDQATGRPIVRLEGPIEQGDYEKFARALVGLQGTKVLLSSPGGLAQEGLQIGRLVHDSGLETAVAKDAICASACGFIWLAGKRKAIEDGGRVGFHAVYLSGEQMSVSSSGNALVGAYLSKLGFSDLVVVYVTEAAPRELRWLTPKDASFLGLQVAWSGISEGPSLAPALSKDEIRQSLLGSEVERARLRRFPREFERIVDAIYTAQNTGEEVTKVYWQAQNMPNDDEAVPDSYVLFAQASDEVIIESFRVDLDLYKKLQKADPELCALTGGSSGISVPWDRVKRAHEDSRLKSLWERRGDIRDRALREPPIHVKPLSRREKAKYDNAIQRIFNKLLGGFSRKEVARLKLKVSDKRRDGAADCRFYIGMSEALLRDEKLLLQFVRQLAH